MIGRPRKAASSPPPDRAREVAVANRHPRLLLNPREITRAIAILDANAPRIGLKPAAVPPGELSLAFLTDADLAQLHGAFLQNPTTTDVITFEGDARIGIAGEICVSVDTAAAYAREHGHEFSTELTLYVVHGWLHLSGHDDLEPAKKRLMRRAESRAMRVLHEARAVPEFKLRRHTVFREVRAAKRPIKRKNG